MGTLWNRSDIVERYADDLRAAGAKAYFYQGGTLTPLSVYEDAGEASAHPHPVVADANGRWPAVFVPYIVSYDVRVTSAFDVQLTYTQEIPNPDPIDLTVTIGAEEKVQTGMIHAEMVNTTKSGYVRLNGRTMGNAASSGTERANADTSALFTYLWNNLTDAIAPVSGGRGGSAAADYAANKTITLVNWQGAVPIGLDDMGASAGSFFSGLTFGTGNATTAGSLTGTNGITLLTANIPAHTHSGTTAAEGAHTHTGTTGNQSANHTHVGTADSGGDHTHTGTTATSAANITAHIRVNKADPGAGTIEYLTDTTNSQGTTTDWESADSHSHTFTSDSNGAHVHTFTTAGVSADHTHSFTTSAGSSHSHTFTTDSVGSSIAFNNLPRSILVTWYIKL